MSAHRQPLADAPELREETPHDSYHIAPLDHDAERVFTGTAAWLRTHRP